MATPKLRSIKLYTDGGARGNPGPAGYGFVVKAITTSGAEIILKKCGDYLGETTNNQAEYQGLLAGFRWLISNHYHHISLDIFLDSLLVERQLGGKYKVKNPGLKPLWSQAKLLLSQFSQANLHHIPRSQNVLADQLANLAMDKRGRVEL